MGRLMSGPNPLGISGKAFVGRLVIEPNSLEAFGLGRLAGVLVLGPRYPQCPPLFPFGEGDPPWSGKKNKVDRHGMGTVLPLRLLNFQHKFYKFFVITLDAIESSGWILRYGNRYKRRG